jgi:hypothetical protein
MRSIRTTVLPDPTGDRMLAFGELLARSGRVIEVEISGSSMGSTLPSGCRIRIRALSSEDYHTGQVVTFVAGNAFIAHRIVYCSREGVLTRGDSQTWCDLPVPASAILGVVSACLVDGEWRLLDDRVPFDCERRNRDRMIETLLRVCLRIDLGLAQRASRMLMRLARWRQRLVPKHVPTQ